MRRKLTRALACFAVAAATAASAAALANCTQNTTVSDTTVSGVIGATGGMVTTATGQVSFPGGALTQDVMITVEDVGDAPGFTLGTQVGPAILCEPEGTSFADPVTITLAFDESEFPAGKTMADIVIFTSPGTGTPNYMPLQTTVVDSKHVQAQTAHFSYFVPAVPGMPILDSAVRDVVTVTGFDSNPPSDDTTPPPPPPPDTSPPVTDTGTVDSKAQDSSTQDSGADTMTPQDSSIADSGTQPDTAVADSGHADTGTMMTMDSGTAPDTAVADTGTLDSGTLDTGTVMESSTAAETSTPTDAGID